MGAIQARIKSEKSDKKELTFPLKHDIILPVMRDKNMKEKTVKVKGPWVNGVQTVKEISLDEWNSYTPLNRRVRGEWFRVVKW
jgi:hypothetical protein